MDKKLTVELIDAYIDIINIVEGINVDKNYIESAYQNAKKRCKILEDKIADKQKRRKKNESFSEMD